MWPCNNVFTSKFGYLPFWNPTHKTEAGTLHMSGTTNSKPPGRIIMMGQSETLSRSHVIFITLFSAGAHRCHLLATANCAIMLSQNRFAEPNRHVLTFLHPILLCTITYLAPLEMHLNINFKYPISILLYFFTSVCCRGFLFQFFWVKKIGKLCQKNSKFILKLLW
jgi:hypothetical protein